MAYGSPSLLSDRGRAWLGSVENVPPQQLPAHAEMAAKTGLMSFQDALMIKQMADQIRASGKNEGVPPNNVMQEKLDMISGRAPVQQMPPPQQPPQDPRMQGGLGAMPAPVMDNAQFAAGGIVAFSGKEDSQVKETKPKWWELSPEMAAIVSNPSFERFAQAVMMQESAGNQAAKSSAGARGVMQLMPSTIKEPGLGVRPPRNKTAEENYRVGKEYLAALYLRYGNMQDALRAYNFGLYNYDSFKTGKPNPKGVIIKTLPAETANYAPGVFDKLAKSGFNPSALEKDFAGGVFKPATPALQTDVVPIPPSGIPGMSLTPARKPSAPATPALQTDVVPIPPSGIPGMSLTPARKPSAPAGLPALVSNDPHALEIFENTLAGDAQRYADSAGGIGSGMPILPSTQMIANAPTTEPIPYAGQPKPISSTSEGLQEILRRSAQQPGSVNMSGTQVPSSTENTLFSPSKVDAPAPNPPVPQETAPPENNGYEGRAVEQGPYLNTVDKDEYLSGFENSAMDKYKALLEEQRKSDAKDRDYDRRMAIANAGFKMAEAAQTHNFMGSLAIGGQEAVKGLSAAKKEADKAQREMDRLLAQMEVAREDKKNSLYAKYLEAKGTRDEKIAELNWRYANTDVDQARAAATARQGALATQIAVSKEGRELLKALHESPEWAKSEQGLADARTPAVIQGWKDYQKKLEQRALAPLMGAAQGAGITANFPTYGTRTVTGG